MMSHLPPLFSHARFAGKNCLLQGKELPQNLSVIPSGCRLSYGGETLAPLLGELAGVSPTERLLYNSSLSFFCFRQVQWQPPQVEQLPVQDADGSCTVIGSPPFIAVLMMASI